VRNFLVRRLLLIIPMIIVISLIIFVLLTLQGDPFHQLLMNPHVRPEDVKILMHNWNWDKPLPIRYLNWLKEFVVSTFVPSAGHGWGFSLLSPGMTARTLILSKLPLTLALSGGSIVLSIIIAVPIGIFSALHQYGVGDNIATFFAFFGMSMPSFWFGIMLIIIFGLKLHWFPISGMHSDSLMVGGQLVDFYSASWLARLVNRAWYMALPIGVLTLLDVGGWMRYMRSSMLEVVRQDYVRTARAKGAPESVVIRKHELRNALIPIITLVGLTLPSIIGGAMITEQVFALDGMGRLSLQAVLGNDMFVAMAILMIDSLLVLFGSLLADILYAVADPRVRYS
jgi:peptide/nickel transport system permease protein